jgi:small ligand-binding sensory domain FIST
VGPVPTGGIFTTGEFGPVGGRNFVHAFSASMALFRAR